jgi:Zn-dependent protease
MTPEHALQIRDAAITLIILIASLAVHEFGHAFVADRLGDPTPRSQGRVTLNPLAHISLIGTIIVPLVMALSNAPGIGWAKPVQVNPLAYRRRNKQGRRIRMGTGEILVSAAGPAMNVLLALLVTVILTVLLATKLVVPGASPVQSEIYAGIKQVIMINWCLVFFNLIPCPPLDGSWILAELLPRKHQRVMDFLEQYGMFILMGLVFTGLVGYLLIPAVYLTALCEYVALVIAH